MKRTNSAAFAHDEDSNSWASEMARVIEAVANGDLSQAMELEMNGRSLRGQFLRTAKTVNSMMSQLNSFASEVTRVARELGTEGKLGGQARVKGVAGIWKDLTARVNQLAANLTAQVRAIAVVARAVTKGDLTQSIAIQARGEVAALRDDLNEMIRNLRETTARNSEQQREILEISDREQRRIGQDLHDDLCQRLTGIEMMSQHLEQNLAARAMPETATAAEITKLVRETISHARHLARGLSPVMLESDGLRPALSELAANAEKLFKISCRFHCDPSVRISNHTVATHLYRIAQEALSNAARHSRAKHVTVSLTKLRDRVLLAIEDDGIGIPDAARKSRGMGLRIMAYRAGMIGGSLAIERGTGGGTSVTCALRLQNDHHPLRIQI